MTLNRSTAGPTSRLRESLTSLSGGLHWWLVQLGEMLPAKIRSGLQHDKLKLVLELQDQQLKISVGEKRWVLPSPWEQSELPDQLKKVISKAQFVTLTLSQDMTLQTRISVPRSARGYIDNVVRFEMDRLTPFKADQVYYDTGSIVDEPGTEQCSVELYLVPIDKLNMILDQLSQLGIETDRVIPHEFTGRPDCNFNMLSKSQESNIKTRSKHFQLSLLTINILLLIAVVTVPLIEKKARIDQLKEQVSELRFQAERVFDIREERQTLFQQQEDYVALRKEQGSTLNLIAELTRLLPDTVWLNKIAMQGSALRIQGEAVNASELIALLQNSGQLTDVSFFSPVTQNPRSGKERFMISAQLLRRDNNASE